MSHANDLDVQRACEHVVISYARASDLGDADHAAALFTEDGQLEMPGGRTYTGRAAIRLRLRDQPSGQVSRHLLSNLTVERRGPAVATGRSCVTIYRATRTGGTGPLPLLGPYLVGEYEDEYRLTAEGWRLATRRLTTIFRRPAD